MSIFSDGIFGTGIKAGTVGPGSSFFDFIKNEASNALGINQSFGIPPSSEKTFVRQGTFIDPRTGEETPQQRTFDGQEPDVRIFIKKRAFGGFKENFTSSLLGDREKKYSRVLKRLFANKVEQLNQYELLTKFVDRLKKGQTPLQGIAFNILTEVFRNGSDTALFDGLTELAREDRQMNNTSLSRWIIDPEDTDAKKLGIGTGVIEFANVKSVQTKVSLDTGDYGSVSLQFEDPFNLMLINPIEIDNALKQESIFNTGAPKEFQGLVEKIESTRQALEADTVSASRNNVISLSFFNVSLSSSDEGAALASTTRDRPFGVSSNSSSTTINSATESSNTAEAGFKITRDIGTGRSVEISASQEVDNQRLFQEEKRNFDNLVSLLKEYVKKTKGLKQSLEEDSLDLRRDLMKNFAGRNLINAMDYVYVYMAGNRVADDKGAPTAANSAGASLRSTFKNLVQSGTIADSITESLFIKLDQEGLIKTKNGSFVFVGLVDQSSRSYSEQGTHTLSVSGSNTMKWLGFSKIDTQPSATQPQGALNFPLTPFEEFDDPDSGETNLRLIAANRENLSTEEREEINDIIKKDPNFVKSVDNFEGLVFKWKKGVFSATANISPAPSNDGNKNLISENEAQFLYGFQINQQAFANLDAANIMSVLISGTPYNFTTFLKNSIRSGIHRPGPDDGTTYASNARSISRAFNSVNGQFEPLIAINISPSEMHDSRISSSFTDADKALEETRNEIKKLTALKAQSASAVKRISAKDTRDDNEKENLGLLEGSKINLDKKIAELKTKANELSSFQTLRQNERKCVYQDTIKEAQSIGLIKGETKEQTFESSLKSLQGILFNNQFKTINDVVFNRDKNYLVISNEYEEDLDVQAFAQFLKSEVADLWKSNYESPLEICKQVAQNLDFEFFCDSNGNLHFRPPQYNKTPLSVLRRLNTTNPNMKVFPPQIIALQVTKEKTLQSKIDRLIQESAKLSDKKLDDKLAEIKTLEEVKNAIEKERKVIEKLTVGQLVSLSGTIFFERFVEVDEQVSLDPKFPDVDQANVDAINQRFDILGPGSHKRFIIKDKNIIDYTFDESSPPYTRADVSGQTNFANINDASRVGIWAGAVDYDLWRQYGYIPQDITKPFLRSSEFQCRPYAEFLIAKAQKQVIKGQVTVVGNEYYQVGDVVFFEPYGLLFYVMSVSHQFMFGDRFTTQLQLSYGRTPGEFIPTPLDVMGKNIIKLGTSVNAIASRQNDGRRIRASKSSITLSDRRERVIGVIKVSDRGGSSSIVASSDNLDRLKRALASAVAHVGQVSFSEVTKQPTIGILEIRHFGNSKAAKVVESWFLDPVDFTRSNRKIKTKGLRGQTISEDNVQSNSKIKGQISIVKFKEEIHRKSADLFSLFANSQPSDADLKNIIEIRVVAKGVTQAEIESLNKHLTNRFPKASNNPS